ncbi:SUMF1/EgtB/PvdO family nonheme iron enzyme, partial [Thermodesulfobacteriota bacterium]
PYQIVDRLGVGGMATVFKAYQPRMDRYVALKVMARHFSKNPEFVSRFSQEARVIAKLEHPHILPVYDFGESEGYTYLAMRIVEGGSLSDLIKRHRKLELDQISRIVSQVGGGLDYAHKKGVIHRDFKPGNVLIDEFENCLLTDFGIAKLVEVTSHLTQTGGILGTPTYISPEQGSGQPIDSRSDIYSLGVVLYQMVVGVVPYKADTPMAVIYKHIHDPLPLPRHRVPDLPESVERVILKALAKDPDDRHATAIELADSLQSAVETFSGPLLPVEDQPVTDLGPTLVVEKTRAEKTELLTETSVAPLLDIEKPVRKTRRLWILSILGLLFLLGLVIWSLVFFPRRTVSISAPLYIETEPSNARVKFLEGDLAFHQGIKLEAGRYHMEVSANGYKTEKLWVDFDAQKDQHLNIRLKPLEAALYVKTQPNEAKVRILNIAPVFFQGMNLEAGRYHVEVTAVGYEEITMWVSLAEGENKTINVRLKQIAAFRHINNIINSFGMEFVYIQPGTFTMGSPPNEPERDNDEKQHKVVLTKGFYMQTTEVTQGQWKAVMGSNPSYFKNCGNDCPVEKISWRNVQEFIRKLNQRESDSIYRLPTEAEWEYACRAGSSTILTNGNLSELKCGYDSNLDNVGWYCGNSSVIYDGCYDARRNGGKSCAGTHIVAQKKPNAWGLYDMHGSVWEWCQDWKGNYPTGSATDPTGPSIGSHRVVRGGSWGNEAMSCRSANRFGNSPGNGGNDLGFRLLRNP